MHKIILLMLLDIISIRILSMFDTPNKLNAFNTIYQYSYIEFFIVLTMQFLQHGVSRDPPRQFSF